jgi:hypothetical protein
MHSSILRRIWLNFMALYLGFIGSFTFFFGFTTFRPEHHWRDLISRNTHLVHQNWYRINFTFNSWVETSFGELLVPEGLYSPVAKYFGTCFKIRIWIQLSRKNTNFINSTQNEGLSPSCTALSFDRFGPISWHSIWVLSTVSYYFPDFQLLDLSITDET